MCRTVSIVTKVRSIGILAVAIALAGAQTAQARPPQSTVINRFYATTKADYTKRYANTTYIPAKFTTLPAGTTFIGFEWFWKGSTTASEFYIVLRHHKGSTINVAGPFKFAIAAGNSATGFPTGGAPYAKGKYDADLVVDNAFAATTTVTIGGS